jgi:hypothetical protein
MVLGGAMVLAGIVIVMTFASSSAAGAKATTPASEAA